MRAGWQVGDLAVCVDGSPCLRTPYPGAPFQVPQGAVCRVIGLGRAVNAPFSLMLEGYRAHCHDAGFGFHVARFRKIRPDEHSGSREDWIDLLKVHKQPERVK